MSLVYLIIAASLSSAGRPAVTGCPSAAPLLRGEGGDAARTDSAACDLLLPRGIESLAAGLACRERGALIPVPEWLDSFLDRAPALRGSGVSFHFDRRSFLLGYTLDLSI